MVKSRILAKVLSQAEIDVDSLWSYDSFNFYKIISFTNLLSLIFQSYILIN